MKNILSIFLILAAIGVYYGYTKNVISEAAVINDQVKEYDQTLEKAKVLDQEKKDLNNILNSISDENKDKLLKMLPDNADNVRLILDIQNVAENAGLKIKNILVNDENKQGVQAQAVVPPSDPSATGAGLGTDTSSRSSYVTLSFSVVSNYENFTIFLPNLEKSLRLVDITGLTIKATDTSNIYNFDVTLRAYWLK